MKTSMCVVLLASMVGWVGAAEISIDPTKSGNLEWNTAIWGSSALPTAGNDYIHDSTTVNLRILGGSGGFIGDKLTLKPGAVIFGKGGGVLTSLVALDGGTWQQRALGTPTVLGNIRVQLDSNNKWRW